MLKLIYGFISLVLFIILIVLYFQNVIYSIDIYFFKGYASTSYVILFVAFISFLLGVFVLLFIQQFFKNDKDLDDFEL